MCNIIHQRFIRIFVVALTIACLISCIVTAQLLFHQCLWWECAPVRSFTLFDLNLPSNLFPIGAEIHDLHFLRGDDVSVEAVSATNYWKNGTSIYIIRRFATEADAIKNYDFESHIKFTKQDGLTDTLATLQGKNADNSIVKCGYVLDDYRCVYAARYAEFTIFFSGSIGDGEMTEKSFQEMIMYIDNKLTNLLAGKSS